ncbi:SAM-dependent methyltransferase [Salinibacillus xinjiangensis]|uniref:SAM-dependent methyltransferase n=1 Tax=Salinibacillus xinjiangensis TaxID=1229268 RepID=A0A6G1X6F7_9BACI|nr:SAM-dependent methyltransferase [Salinibacillus xinjiangensis]MRG86583.1 hypothetical protein [Salinibacillus xinjiangensis]
MKEIIRNLIRNSDEYAIPYDTFIEQALYHPAHGYYTKEHEVFGKEGDFFTASTTGSVFAEVMAHYFIRAANILQLPLNILELGGGNGRFAKQVLATLEKYEVERVNYIFIEKNLYSREKVQQVVPKQWGFQSYQSIHAFNEDNIHFEGIVFSNEFLDAQPVSVVVNRGDLLKEIWVTLDESGEFVEVERKCSQQLLEWIEKYQINLANNQKIEVPLYMEPILNNISGVVKKGLIITFDYGYQSEEIKHPSRKDGSLRGYDHHQLKPNVLKNVGNMDITHHVLWEPWIEIGHEKDIKTLSLLNQSRFLQDYGRILDYLGTNDVNHPFSPEAKRNRTIMTLINGEWMGNMLDVCIQTKGVNDSLTNKFIQKYEKERSRT